MSEYEIPEKYLKKLEKLSKQVEEPIDDLKSDLNQRFIELKVKYKERSLDALWRLAYFGFMGKWRSVLRAKPWTGFFFGETEVRDWTQITKRQIDNMPSEEKEKYITETGEYLNPYPNSRNYLEPLPDHRYFKNMYGIIGEPGFKKPVFSVLEWNGPIATKIPEHSFEAFYDFRATERKSSSIKRLGGIKATRFKPSKFTCDRKSMEELVRTLGPYKQFRKLSDYYELLGRKKAAQEVILVEAGIRSLGKSKTGYVMTLEDADEFTNPITAFIPEFVSINAGKGSIVLVLGTMFKDRSDRLCLNTYGIFPTEEGLLAPDMDFFGEQNNEEN